MLVSGVFREPIYHLAKAELFDSRLLGAMIVRAGAFPVRRGERDADALETARVIVRRGGILMISPEGTRIRTGRLGDPRPGVGRLALATGAPVLPVAMRGGQRDERNRVLPSRLVVGFGPPIPTPDLQGREPRREEAVAHTATIWAGVREVWERLGALSGPTG